MIRKLWINIAIIILLVLLGIGLYNSLEVTKYIIHSSKVSKQFRIILVTDMHSCNYGKNSQKLINMIENQSPDFVLLGGDIFDDKLSDEKASALLKSIGKHFPSYYVTGNHEYLSGLDDFQQKMSIIDENKITHLNNECVALKNFSINICGVNDPYAYTSNSHLEFQKSLKKTAKVSLNGNFSILLSHRPEFFNEYSKYQFDLVLTGHAHGGQWRLPFISNGVFAPNQGLFPKYTCGIHRKKDTQMIISRGLAKESTLIPRFNNRPELVVIDIIPKHKN